jgi:uncharacterized protein YggE
VIVSAFGRIHTGSEVVKMKPLSCAGLVVALAVLCSSAAFAQWMAAPSPANTLTVSVIGTGESPAEWVEVNLTVEGRGVNAQEALAVCEQTSRQTMDDLTGLGVPEDAMRCTAPQISGGGLAEMMGAPPQGEQQGKFAISRSVVVRLADFAPETLYEDICRIIDVATDAGAGPKPLQQWSDMMSSGGIITFGVNDPQPLRAQAIANGLEQAKEVADAVAARTGRKVLGLAGVAVQEFGNEGALAAFTSMMIGSPPTAGQAVYQVMLTVTYQLE